MNLTCPILGLLSILIAFAIPITTAKDTCPPKEILDPCTCEDVTIWFDHVNEWENAITCRNITEMDTLVSVDKRSGDRRFKYFYLANSCLMYLPAAFLQSKRIKELLILSVTMDSVFDKNPPIGNELEMLVLERVFLRRGIEWDKFENLSKLTFLLVTRTEVKLGRSFIRNVGNKKIVRLYFENTNTTKLDDHVFASLKQLRHLQVRRNKIKTLKRNMFPRPAAIESIDFTANEIETLPEDIFSDMPRLYSVQLGNNKISKFTKTTFGGVFEKGVNPFLENNPLTCDCSIKWFVNRQDRKRVVHGTCQEPLDKKGRRISYIKKEDLDYCPQSPQSADNMLETILHE